MSMGERLRYLGSQAYQKRNVLIPIELVRLLEQQGLEQGLSVNEVINTIISKHYKKEEVCQ